MKAVLREVGITLAMAIIIFLILQATIQSFVVVEHCMEPEFYEGDRLLVNKVVYHFTAPDRGDVIILHPPLAPNAIYIKRVIAIPGDSVEVKNGAVYVNGTRLEESYLTHLPAYTFDKIVVPADEYFVLGDNRNIANDSHKGWTLPRENIVGKVWLTFWPSSEWGLVVHYPLEEQLASSAE